MDKGDSYIEYAMTDSNDPLYIFNSFSVYKNFIRPHKLIREVGSYAVGVEYSMMRHLGVFQGDSILTFANFNNCMGLTYSAFGPLLRGASSLILEDPLIFLTKPAKMLTENNIQTLVVSSDTIFKIIQLHPNFLENCGLDFLFVEDDIKDESFEKRLLKECKKNKIQINNCVYSSELGVVLGCEDWTQAGTRS